MISMLAALLSVAQVAPTPTPTPSSRASETRFLMDKKRLDYY